jgi:hypothetical protein
VIEHVLLWSLVVMFSMKQIVIWIPLRWGPLGIVFGPSGGSGGHVVASSIFGNIAVFVEE